MVADDVAPGSTTGRSELPRVAVVGAGLAGLVCASELRNAGFDVRVLEKSRGAGGRQSTRRARLGERELVFDHGAQYFTVRNPDFDRFLEPFRIEDEPLVREWSVPIVVLAGGKVRGRSESTRRYVFCPAMNAFPRRLASLLQCRFEVEIASCRRERGIWKLRDAQETVVEEAEVLVLTAPAPQCLRILPPEASLRARLETMRYAPSWTLMAHFAQPLRQAWGGAFVDDSPLAWVANNDTKPGRESGEGESWVLHATPEWSHAHIEDDPGAVGDAMLEAFARAIGQPLPEPAYREVHRWRYALPTAAAGDFCLWSANERLGVASDGCPEGARVEGAFASGRALARRIDASLSTSA